MKEVNYQIQFPKTYLNVIKRDMNKAYLFHHHNMWMKTK